MDTQEQELLQELKSGKYGKFSRLTERYGRMCVHFFLLKCRCPMETALDLCQETFIRVFRSLHGFDVNRPFKAWLMAICRNVAVDHLKSEGNRIRSIRLWIPPVGPNPEQTALNTVAIHEAMEKLPERQAEVVLMHYFWDLSCAEIGKVLEISEGTVKCHLFQARQKLLELLQEKRK